MNIYAKHHEQHHSHNSAAPVYGVLSWNRHEGALAGSFALLLSSDMTVLEPSLTRELYNIRDFIWEKGGIIGHIKASLEEPQTISLFSITDRELCSRREISEKYILRVAVIAFMPEEKEFAGFLESCMKRLKSIKHHEEEKK